MTKSTLKKRLALSLFIAFLLCVGQRNRLAPSERDAFSTRGPAAVSTPTFEGLIRLLQENPAPTVDEALARLRERYPEWMSFYTLVYRSHSLQKASYQNPRAVIFGPDASFILTFNGDPKHPGFGSFETMAYDTARGSYAFREIVFKSETNPRVIKKEMADYQAAGDGLLVSPKNSTRCMDCHGYVNIHPIWESYFDWPGVYGSNDDNLFRKRNESGARLAFLRGLSTPNDRSREADGWEQFSKKPEGRYAHLPTLNPGLIPYEEQNPRPNFYLTVALQEQAIRNLAKSLLSFQHGDVLASAVNTFIACADEPDLATRLFGDLTGFEGLDKASIASSIERMNVTISLAKLENLEDTRAGEPGLSIQIPATAHVPAAFLKATLARQRDLAPSAWSPQATHLTVVIEKILKMNGQSLDLYALPFRRHFAFNDGYAYLNALTFELRKSTAPEASLIASLGRLGNVLERTKASPGECARMIPEARSLLEGIDWSAAP